MKTINDYAELVKEKHALNKTIAPVETNETDASRAYAVGEQLIYNGTLYDVIAPISQHDVITTTGSGANIAPAGSISAKIQTLTNEASAIVNKLGAKNVMPVTMDVLKKCNTSGTWNDNVYTFRGITYTIFTDNFGNVTKINANGTSSEASAHLFFANGYKTPSELGLELNVEYALNGCPDGGSAYGYSVCYDSGGAWSYPSDFGESASFTFTDNTLTYRPMIKVRNAGTIVDNKDFYPMLRDASIANPDYVPYAKTNRELSAENEALTNLVDCNACTSLDDIKNLIDLPNKKAIYGEGKIGILSTSALKTLLGVPFSANYINVSIERLPLTGVPMFKFTAINAVTGGSVCVKYGVRVSGNDVFTEWIFVDNFTIKDVSGYSWDSAIDGAKDIIVKRYGAIVSVYGYFRSTNALAQYANVLSGLPHCASGAAKSTDMLRNMGMTLSNVDSATSKIVIDSATTADLQYGFNFTYLTDK